jgi:hypothetical protein
MVYQLFSLSDSVPRQLAKCKPCHAHDHVQPLGIGAGVLERPHSIAVNVPERPRSGVHAALPSVGGGAVCSSRLVDQALLHNGAVHGEAVWRRSG